MILQAKTDIFSICAPGLTGVISGSVLQPGILVKWASGSAACALMPSLPPPAKGTLLLSESYQMERDFPRQFLKSSTLPLLTPSSP